MSSIRPSPHKSVIVSFMNLENDDPNIIFCSNKMLWSDI